MAQAQVPQAAAGRRQRNRRLSPFWRHYLEMAAVMVVGMVAAAAVLIFFSGVKSWDQVTVLYPAQALMVVAAGMTFPMAAWILFRGMGRRNSLEMGAAMALPVIPFLCLVWFGIAQSVWCGPYCISTFVAMYLLMRYRREEYSPGPLYEEVPSLDSPESNFGGAA